MASVPGGWEFVQYQLDAEKRLLGYAYYPGDAAKDNEATGHLAQWLYARGITDIRDIALYRGQETIPPTPQNCTGFGGEDASAQAWWCEQENARLQPTVLPVWWLFNKRTNARLEAFGNSGVPGGCTTRHYGENEIPETQCVPQPADDGPVELVNVELPDRMRVNFSVRFIGADKVAVFIPRIWRQESGWESFRGALLFFFGAASLLIPGLGTAIGSYVFSASFAAAYPAVVSVATNVAFNAVLGGMDVEHAVGRALASYAGSLAGGVTGAQFDSALVGRLTAATTTAMLNGQDIAQAVATASLSFAASGQPAFNPTPTPPPTPTPGEELTMDDEFGGNFYAFDPSNEMDPYAFLGAGGGGGFDIDLSGDPMMGGDYGGVIDTGEIDPMYGGGYPTDVPANQPPVSPSETVDTGFDWDNALATVTKTALAALQLYKGYQATQQVRAPAPSQTVNRNGTITTRSPTGMTSTGKPPVGTPVAVGDGSLIMNNGDGTYTLIGADGSRNTYRYPDASGGALALGGNSNMLLYAGLGIGALLLLSRRK